MRLAAAEVALEKRADGSMLLRSPQQLAPYARCVSEWLMQWSDRAPERVFLAERTSAGAWKKVGYREAYGAVRRIGQALLERGLGAEKPVAILSDNSIDHALLSLGAMHVGVPVVPISPAYSLMSKDFGKLKYIFDLVRPGLVFAAETDKFAPALATVGARSTPVAELLETNPGSTLEREFLKVGPDTVAKILSGPTRWRRSSSPRDRPARQKGSSTRNGCCARTSSRRCRRGPSCRTGRRWSSTGCRGTTPSAATTTST
jgi:feruloyl-CoA synthase